MVSPTRELLYFFVPVVRVDFHGINAGGLENRVRHFLPPLVVVVACEVYCPVYTVGKKGVVVPCCDKINWVFNFYLDWNIFNAFAPECPLIIASEGEDSAISGEHY